LAATKACPWGQAFFMAGANSGVNAAEGHQHDQQGRTAQPETKDGEVVSEEFAHGSLAEDVVDVMSS
jgi:hypothetical protein